MLHDSTTCPSIIAKKRLHMPRLLHVYQHAGMVDGRCGGCLVWWMSSFTHGLVDVQCVGCLVWWMSGVADVWCGGCLVLWMSVW